jgi:signal peptidase
MKILPAVLFGLTDVVVIIFLLFPFPFGGKWIMVLSGSMTPALQVGGLVLVMPVKPASVDIGDILVHNPPGYPDVMIAHRVVEKLEGDTLEFRTKGDANEEADTYLVGEEQVVGTVLYHIPQLAYIINNLGEFGKTPMGMVLLMGIPGVLIVAIEIRNIIMARNPLKIREEMIKKRTERRKKAFKRAAT